MTTDCCNVDASHSLSEENQEPELAQQFKPFDIILVDIQKAITEEKIHCVKKRLAPGVDLNYVAISYRWGELDEDVIATIDYDAHITSFKSDHFMQLCLAISKEVDMCTIQYVWVDVLCINQANESQRKETIYHMSNIYEHANRILAVPDLHLAYLLKHPLNDEVIEWINDNVDYIYHIIMNNWDHVDEIDNLWMEKELKIPKHLRRYMKTRFMRFGREACFFAGDAEVQGEAQEKILLEELMLLEEPGKTKQSNDGGHLAKLKLENSINGLIRKWQDAVDDRYKDLERALKFLLYLAVDWSKRTWVISEYSIAKKKNNGKIKYWFVSLFRHIRPDDPHFTFTFFETDTKDAFSEFERNLRMTNKCRLSPVSIENLYEGSLFRISLSDAITSSSFLDMLLASNASKNSDRFHAILPLFEKYRRRIIDENTIKNWKITTMVSVRMRVRQWLTAEENLGLLYEQGMLGSLPSFDNIKMDDCGNFGSYIKRVYNQNKGRCNYDLIDSSQPAVTVQDTIDKGDDSIIPGPALRYSMHIYPKFYQAKEIAFVQNTSHIIRNRIWKQLEIDPYADQLTWLRIPLSFPCDDPMSMKSLTKYIVLLNNCSSQRSLMVNNILELIGSRSKNIWMVVNDSKLLTEEYTRSLNDWAWGQRGTDALRVY